MKTPTYRLTTNKGFTLLEILLAITLLSILAVAILPNMQSVFRVGVQSSVRRFSAVVRYAYDQAILTGKLHRIVISLDDPQGWKLESASPGALPVDKAKMGLLVEGQREEDRKLEEPEFKESKESTLGTLPKGTRILNLSSWRTGKTPQDKGSFSIYAFPSGMIDEATIEMAEDGKESLQKFIVTIHPLTGRTTVQTETGGVKQ